MSLPVLPLLSATWKARVFGEDATNHSVNGSEGIPALPDAERLAFIGDTIVHLGITNWLHGHYPQHSHQSLKEILSNLLSAKPREWAMLYKLRSHGIIDRTQEPGSTKNRPISKGDLFHAYIGAVYLDRGGDNGGSAITSRWIKEIMDFDGEQGHKSDEDDRDSVVSTDVISAKGKESDETQISSMLNSLSLPSGHPVQNPKPILQLPINIPVSSSRNCLSILNEKASQKKSVLAWDDSSTGLDHAKIWATKLTVEGKDFIGTGQNKKQARGAAAELALTALKWT